MALSACDGCGDPGTTPRDEDVCDGCRDAPDLGSADGDAPDLPPVVGADCDIGPAGGFCRTTFCRVTVEPGIFEAMTHIDLTEGEAPRAVADDILGARTCILGEFDAVPTAAFTLAIRYTDADIPADFFEGELLGAELAPEFRAAEAAHDIERNELVFTIDQPIEVAVSALPAFPNVDAELGIDAFDVNDPASYARNLSRYSFGASFHDGERFYAANGPRVLIWNGGIPTDPTQPPDVVLGRPDLASDPQFTSASNFSNGVNGIWSDGTKLAISEGHRVLIWNQVPTQNFASADLVLGQDDFTSKQLNKGRGPGADTMYVPDEIWSDGTRMIVADAFNHRFLVWNSFPVINNQPADLVVGQAAFTGGTQSAGALNVFRARGVYHDGVRTAFVSTFACNCIRVLDGFPTQNNPAETYLVGYSGSGSRVMADSYNNPGAITPFGPGDGIALRNGYRVSVWNSFPGVDDSIAAFTLGRPDEVLGTPFERLTSATFGSQSPDGHVWSNAQQMAVADGPRLLIWTTLPSVDFTQADLVIGQPTSATNDLKTDFRGISRRTLAQPAGVSSAGDVTVVADRANSRVLVLRGPPGAPNDVVVLGQPDGESYMPNLDWRSAGASTMNLPTGVFTDGARVIVADTANHRVLIWNQLPTIDGTPADVVLGQATANATGQNGGIGDVDGDGDFDADAGSMHFPSGVFFDGRLLVADTFNHRVLVYDTLPTTTGALADSVIGQPDFEANDPNRGLGWYARSASSFARPVDVTALADGRIAVSDSENNRVLLFDTEADDPAAAVVLGRPDFTSDPLPNWIGGFNGGYPTPEASRVPSAATLRRPYGLAADGDALHVADSSNHRVMRFEGPFSSGMAASAAFAQAGFDTRAANAGGLNEAAVNGAEGVAITGSGALLVADTKNHRLLVTDGTAGSAVFGQTLFDRNGINGSAPAFNRLDGPAGLAVTKDGVWVADREQHRVVVFRGGELEQIVGQSDRGGGRANAGFAAPQPWSMSRPSDVWTDGNMLVVADRDNHRVLIWNAQPTSGDTPPDVVVGQPSATVGLPNAGRGATSAGIDTMLAPEGVLVHGASLYVADTGNSRVLVYDTIPTATGTSASRVLCQSAPTQNRPNRGNAGPSADTCAGPTDTLVIGERLYVVDTLNHRVLGFDVDAETGAEADQVLGQPDFTSRAPLDDDNLASAALFSNPVRLAHDGTNFYVVDRGNHRVLVYDTVPTGDFVPADRLLGQTAFDVSVVTPNIASLDSPFGIAVLPAPYRAATVWVSDSGSKNRVTKFVRVARPY